MQGDEVGGPIRWRMHIPVPRERVFAALNTDEGRASFWAESAIEKDGYVEFHFSNGYRCKSRVLHQRAPELFALDYIGGPVRFELSSDGAGGTDLLLTHDGIEPEDWNEVHAGWLNVLFPLKAWLAHGVDLRNHDSTRSWDQGYADQ
jgi:uncharacterized protein YndB with AHSA1/START domain